MLRLLALMPRHVFEFFSRPFLAILGGCRVGTCRPCMVGARHPRARINTSSYGMNACMLARSARAVHGADAQVPTAVLNLVRSRYA
jgi:hypothetical protein